MEIQQIKIKQHFYYCIFIALLVEIKAGKIKSNKHKKKFLLGWVNRAKRSNIFSSEVDDEIIWLKQQLIFGHVVGDIELLLKEIYDSALLMGLRFERNFNEDSDHINIPLFQKIMR